VCEFVTSLDVHNVQFNTVSAKMFCIVRLQNSDLTYTGRSGSLMLSEMKINQLPILWFLLPLILITWSRDENQSITDPVVPPATYSNHLVGHAIDFNVDTPNGWCNGDCLYGRYTSKLQMSEIIHYPTFSDSIPLIMLFR